MIVVDHGSRRAEANQRHEAFVRSIADRSPYDIVEPAHMELAEPSITTAFDVCVGAGAGVVVVSPFFLWPGDHWDRDIPRLSADAARGHPGVTYLVAAPLGAHPILGELAMLRIGHCLEHATGRAPECELCAGSGRCGFRSGGPV